MNIVDETCAAIRQVDHEAAKQTQKRLDAKTKPRGSLGVLESLACRLAAIYGHAAPALPAKAIVVMAGDHGVAQEGVSAYPSEVTGQMLRNFAHGGAAINVLARQAGAKVFVVNMGLIDDLKQMGDPLSPRTREERAGVRGDSIAREKFTFLQTTCSPSPLPLSPEYGGEGDRTGVYDAPLGPGTANMACGPAMTLEQARQGLETGIQVATDLCAAGIGLIGVGDMGIGNTTAASALTAVFTGAPPNRVTGRGTGIDEAAWKRKVAVIEKALAVNDPSRIRPLEALANVGGFELAGLAGVMLGAAAKRVPIVLDGFITGAAALVAVALCPRLRDYLIAAHQSVEPGHGLILEHLELRPLLNLDLRLGEGTGAALAMHLIEAALRIVGEMATFTSAGVTNAGV